MSERIEYRVYRNECAASLVIHDRKHIDACIYDLLYPSYTDMTIIGTYANSRDADLAAGSHDYELERFSAFVGYEYHLTWYNVEKVTIYDDDDELSDDMGSWHFPDADDIRAFIMGDDEQGGNEE